ncbi:hypothetical protein SETIT_5G222200v2 [Setaria italica]|uniref:Uncharacterized protein n=2 Tax=Setaria italica TaxID=4555 RepID=A0A368R7G7_SETIT|nr:hypothetical protein SETIT_5G222200v2 [Setaria italica]
MSKHNLSPRIFSSAAPSSNRPLPARATSLLPQSDPSRAREQPDLEVAREQDVMMRQAAAYAHAVPGSSAGATVAVVPPDAVPYEGGFLFQQQQQPPPSQALTYQMEQSPPPSSSGQSHPEVSRQQNTDGSDEGSGGGGVPPA